MLLRYYYDIFHDFPIYLGLGVLHPYKEGLTFSLLCQVSIKSLSNIFHTNYISYYSPFI
jgi:hypothetical protein